MPTMNSRVTYRSESEKFTLKEIFKIFLQDFIDDFSFSDISSLILNSGLFTDDEVNRIRTETNLEKQTCLVLFTLLDKDKDLDVFLNILQNDYGWLPQKIQEAHRLYLEGNKNLVNYIMSVHELRSHYPKHADFNVHRLNYFYTAREILKKLKPRQYLVIHGELGFGKKWLALDVCCDYSVMEAMDFKIYWLDVHNCDSQERDLEKLQRLKLLLGENRFQAKIGDYEGISNKILELQQNLRTLLKEPEFKDCLLVLVDVQNRKTLEAFNLPCKMLITTRNKNIAEHLPNSLTKTFHVREGLNQAEYDDLFEKILKQNKRQFPDNYSDIFYQLRGHPFLLNIIAQNLKGKPKAEWNMWIKNLEHFRFKDDKINNLIQLSFNILNPREQELYSTLSIFYHSVKIPVKVLSSLWDVTEKEAQDIIKRFDKFSLVNIAYLKDETMVFIIHFLYYSYLQYYVKIEKTALHQKLIENYEIENILNSRTEIDLLELPNDNYFYYFIGYHLREASRVDLFPKLYLDFGFLGQKLRATGLASTIGDLKYYRSEITNHDKRKDEFVKNLLEFLPNIEEMIFRSNDTCLLQYALMAGGAVQMEAENQAVEFSHQMWFSDGDHFHRRRQMIKLPDKPRVLKLVEPDTCIIALDNHIMLLADLSLGYNIEPTKFVGHTNKITSMSIFSKNYVISLDLSGELRVWSIADERRRFVQRKPSSRSIDNHVLNYESFCKMRTKECLQQIDRDMNRSKVSVNTYRLETAEDNTIYLHLVFSNGDINICKWHDDRKLFIPERIPTLNTRLPSIRFLLKLFNRFYMILNNSGSLEIFKLTDGSNGCPMSFRWPPNTNSPVNIHYFKRDRTLVIIIVFVQQVLQLRLQEQALDFLNGELETLFEITERRSAITCSSLSDDHRYLVVGTKQGIIVYDILEKSEVLRNSISESIACIDICCLDDDIYKYVIVSGSEGRTVLNIFGLKLNANHSITWANSISALVNEKESSLQFEPNTWLLGKRLFEVNFTNDIISLVAVDSKNRVHHLLDNKWEMIVPENLDSKISAISAFADKYYFGCENGDLYDSCENKLQTDFSSQITFLKLLNENILVGSHLNGSFLLQNNDIYRFDISIEDCYKFREEYLILLDKNCGFMILDLKNNCQKIHEVFEVNTRFKDSDLKENFLVLATNKHFVYVYELIIESGKLLKPRFSSFKREANEQITSVGLSAEASLCAVGLDTGLIEVYRKDKSWVLMHKLDSHKFPIYDLKFSPWTDFNASTILVSVSEQICFWDITYIVNNPLDHVNGFARHSSRFSSNDRDKKRNSRTSITSISKLSKYIINPWSNKKGPSDKRELLACIKFAGNQCEKIYTNENFTKFVTIDDEGEYYLLAVNEISMNGTTNGDYNEQIDIDNDNAII